MALPELHSQALDHHDETVDAGEGRERTGNGDVGSAETAQVNSSVPSGKRAISEVSPPPFFHGIRR